MKTLEQMAKKDNQIMKALKVSEIRHSIAWTSKGELALMLNFGEDENKYRYVLDAVPVDNEINGQLLKLFEGVIYAKAN